MPMDVPANIRATVKDAASRHAFLVLLNAMLDDKLPTDRPPSYDGLKGYTAMGYECFTAYQTKGAVAVWPLLGVIAQTEPVLAQALLPNPGVIPTRTMRAYSAAELKALPPVAGHVSRRRTYPSGTRHVDDCRPAGHGQVAVGAAPASAD